MSLKYGSLGACIEDRSVCRAGLSWRWVEKKSRDSLNECNRKLRLAEHRIGRVVASRRRWWCTVAAAAGDDVDAGVRQSFVMTLSMHSRHFHVNMFIIHRHIGTLAGANTSFSCLSRYNRRQKPRWKTRQRCLTGLLSRRSRQRERLNAMGLSICLSVC